MSDVSKLWDEEYDRGGIPCTGRSEPSTTLRWFLSMVPFLRPGKPLAKVFDIGCGTGRNSLFLAEQGLDVVGIDTSTKAIAEAKKRTSSNASLEVHEARIDQKNEFIADGAFDGAIDIFVSKHLVSPLEREKYKIELDRVLAQGALLLVSLAAVDDGYYSQFLPGGSMSGERVVKDPVSGISSLLFTREELIEEFKPFKTVAFWDKRGSSKMYGEEFERHVLAFIFQKQ